jgi:HEAT repeat protein
MNRNNTFILRICARRFALCTAIVLSISADVGAQEEASIESNGATFEVTDFERTLDGATRTALTEARRQLERALAHPDGDTRFEALREAIVLHEPWIAGFVLPLCESPDLTERSLALEAVAASDPRQGRRAFLTALEDGHRGIRLRGLLGLEKLGDAGTVVDIIRILEGDEDPDLRVVAARALGAIADIGVSSALRRAIESPYAPLREQAVLALLAIGKEDVGRYLIRLLDDDDQTGTVEILKLVALVPDPSLIELLTPYLDHERQRIRSHASVTVLSILERSRTGAP